MLLLLLSFFHAIQTLACNQCIYLFQCCSLYFYPLYGVLSDSSKISSCWWRGTPEWKSKSHLLIPHTCLLNKPVSSAAALHSIHLFWCTIWWFPPDSIINFASLIFESLNNFFLKAGDYWVACVFTPVSCFAALEENLGKIKKIHKLLKTEFSKVQQYVNTQINYAALKKTHHL